jgi:hypothetical protein
MKGLPWMSEAQFKAQIWRNAMWFTAWKDGKDGIPWPECWEKLAAKTNQELGPEWDKTMASQECHEAWKTGRQSVEPGALTSPYGDNTPAKAVVPPLIGRYEAR